VDPFRPHRRLVPLVVAGTALDVWVAPSFFIQARFLREAYFNFPKQISTYHVLQSMRLMDSSERGHLQVCTGPYSEAIWKPIADCFEKLGGERHPYTMATDWL
jgi:hypothetical protein